MRRTLSVSRPLGLVAVVIALLGFTATAEARVRFSVLGSAPFALTTDSGGERPALTGEATFHVIPGDKRIALGATVGYQSMPFGIPRPSSAEIRKHGELTTFFVGPSGQLRFGQSGDDTRPFIAADVGYAGLKLVQDYKDDINGKGLRFSLAAGVETYIGRYVGLQIAVRYEQSQSDTPLRIAGKLTQTVTSLGLVFGVSLLNGAPPAPKK